MDWAVVKIAGKQHKVAPGDKVEVDKGDQSDNKKIDFSEVLLLVSDNKIILGQPTVKNSKVLATVIGDLPVKKIRVVKFKPKSRYLKTHGSKRKMISLRIEKITHS